MQFRLDDDAALCSIEILAEAVDRVCTQDAMPLRMLRNALREAVKRPAPDTVKTAFAMFARLDGDYRRLVAHEALTLATRQKGKFAPRERAVRRTRLG